MIDDTTKEQLVTDFRAWLDELNQDPVAQLNGDAPAPDLFTFYGELAALRQEISMQTRGVHRNAQDMTAILGDLKGSLTSQSSAIENAAREVKAQVPQARTQGEDAVLLELIRIREAFADNAEHFATQKLHGFFTPKADRDLLIQQQQHLNLLVKKADDALRRFDVTPVASVGEPFDATTMRAIAVSDNNDSPPGAVTKIFSQGFRRNQKILTTAEVEVRKQA